MYHLYVIRLDESVWQENRFRARNLQRTPGRPCVYVGQTAKDPRERLAQHLSGVKAGRFVPEYGIELVEELTGPIEAESRQEAERMEAGLARELRERKGWGVWSN